MAKPKRVPGVFAFSKLVTVDLYRSDVLVVFADTLMDGAKHAATKCHISSSDMPGPVDGALTIEPDPEIGAPTAVVLFTLDAAPGIIAHEAIHAAWAIAQSVGIALTYENHETLAYIAEKLVDDITEIHLEASMRKLAHERPKTAPAATSGAATAISSNAATMVAAAAATAPTSATASSQTAVDRFVSAYKAACTQVVL